MRVRVYDPYIAPDAVHALGAEPGGLEEVLTGADAVSLHLPMTPETKRVLSRERMLLMNKGAVVINCARGGLVDEEALAALIQSGHVGGAGLDVFEKEPEIPLSLRKTHRVILTPHVAGNTEEAQERVGIAIAHQVADFLLEGVAAHAVNLPNLSAASQRAIQPYLPLARNLSRLASSLAEGPWTELGLRVYGDLADMDITLLRMHVLAGLLAAHLEGVSPFNAEVRAKERGVTVVETRSNRDRAYRNLLSLQLRGGDRPLWIEGTHLAPGNDRLVSLNGIAVEAPLA